MTSPRTVLQQAREHRAMLNTLQQIRSLCKSGASKSDRLSTIEFCYALAHKVITKVDDR